MALYSDPPPYRVFSEDKPTLLVCWWITVFCTTIILLRIAGRFIRSEHLFVEDRTVALAIIPLFLRMGCVHVILTHGTNNADFTGIELTANEIRRRHIGSGLVLASRVLHAATLWILKVTILEFFRRINDALSERFSHFTLIFIRCTLVATFVATIISDLAECQPFTHYWQVLPDPGGRCRQGYAQLITLSVCNVLTDLLLVFFPIPIILFSHQSVKRRIQLILLFSLSLSVVGATLYRVNQVIRAHGNQQTRSLLASVELLFATTAANGLVLGSFVRDRGVKKNKFRGGSVVDSMDRGSIARSRRPTVNRHWGSDEDLVRDLGLGVRRDLRLSQDLPADDNVILGGPAPDRSPRAPPAVRVDGIGNDSSDSSGVIVIAGQDVHGVGDNDVGDMHRWQFPESRKSGTRSEQSMHSGQSDDDALLAKNPAMPPPQNNAFTITPRKVSFFDPGGLLNDTSDLEAGTRSLSVTSGPPSSRRNSATLPLDQKATPLPAYTAGSRGLRRGSSALLQDLGGLLSPPSPKQRHLAPQESSHKYPYEVPPSPSPSGLSTSSPIPVTPHSNLDNIVLMDPGGLLGPSARR